MQVAQGDAHRLNLNEVPDEAEEEGGLDLNQLPVDQDLDPVIINPLQNDSYG